MVYVRGPSKPHCPLPSYTGVKIRNKLIKPHMWNVGGGEGRRNDDNEVRELSERIHTLIIP